MAFEPNVGQTDPAVRFLARTSGETLFLTPSESVLAGPTGGLRLRLDDANNNPDVVGVDQLPGKLNYFRGPDPMQWRAGLPLFAKVQYRNVYPGIDVEYHGTAGQVEYDFVIAPGADPAAIGLAIAGVTALHVDHAGHLVGRVGGRDVRQGRPVAFQGPPGARRAVSAAYRIDREGRVTFSIGAYDPQQTLVIDPIIYSTYLGGTGNEAGAGIAVDGSGAAYVTGSTNSTNFPTAGTPFQGSYAAGSGTDAFLTKINPSASALVYSTYVGGMSNDESFAVAVDASGNAYMTGSTMSTDFPTMSAFQATLHGSRDAFVAKFGSTGGLVYSTYLGGASSENVSGYAGIAVDASGNAYVAGDTNSSDFPTPGAFQSMAGGSGDGFVAKVGPNGSTLVFSSYLGGTGQDGATDIALDSGGAAYVTGFTDSTNFPLAGTPFQGTKPGGAATDAFVSKVNASGTALTYSTYLGGATGNDGGRAIDVDGTGNAYVAGITESTDFPTAGTPFQPTKGGAADAFVTKLNPTGSGLVYSTFLGGSGGEDQDFAEGIRVDTSGVAHVAGQTRSQSFPTKDPIQQFNRGASDAFVSHVSANGSALLFSTYLGSSTFDGASDIDIDSSGNDYIAGGVQSTDFPTAGPPLQPSFGGGVQDGFIAKLSAGGTPPPPHQKPPADFDGNGSTDISVFRPSTGAWLIRNQTTLFLGVSGDIPVPCDYDGNGTTDGAVFRPSVGGWYINGQSPVFFGLSGDIPVPGDYNGDGRCEIAVFRPSVGGWYIQGQSPVFFGLSGDIPVPGDYDGNGTADIAVFRPSVGGWYRNGAATTFFGLSGDVPVPGDYDGNGTTDLAIFRPSVGGWYVNGQSPQFLGLSSDIPQPGDYDGNGTTDIAVYRPSTGAWYIDSQAPVFFGTSGDLPLPLPSAIRMATSS